MRILSLAELTSWVQTHVPHGVAMAILFAGDRLSCVDEAVGLEVDDEVVGVATIAPEGEQLSGEPTIVAIYVRSEFRKRGLGRTLLMVAIDRCRERGLVPVRMDALTTPALRAAENMPEDYRQDLRLVDASSEGTLDAMFLE